MIEATAHMEAPTTRAGKRTKGKAKAPLDYFCMNVVDKVQCTEKDGGYECRHYHPVYDYRKGETMNRRQKVASVPNVYAILLSSRVDAKEKTINISSHVSNVRCYVSDDAMECINPARDDRSSQFPCPKPAPPSTSRVAVPGRS